MAFAQKTPVWATGAIAHPFLACRVLHLQSPPMVLLVEIPVLPMGYVE